MFQMELSRSASWNFKKRFLEVQEALLGSSVLKLLEHLSSYFSEAPFGSRSFKMKLAALFKKLQFEAASFKAELPASFGNFQIELLGHQNAKFELEASKRGFSED